MRLSKKSEYALRALLPLTEAYGLRPVRRSDIAEQQHIPLGFLETILLQLKHAGVLASRPGVDGGFRLIKKPEHISLGSIIRALDGPLAVPGTVFAHLGGQQVSFHGGPFCSCGRNAGVFHGFFC